jgi:uncharacterized Zn finger protein (UPF0148 family)
VGENGHCPRCHTGWLYLDSGDIACVICGMRQYHYSEPLVPTFMRKGFWKFGRPAREDRVEHTRRYQRDYKSRLRMKSKNKATPFTQSWLVDKILVVL